MTVCRIENYNIHVGSYKLSHSVKHICGDTHAGSAQKPSLGILGCKRVLDSLLDIFDGDKSLKVEIVVNNGELFLAGSRKYLLGIL